MPVTRPPASPRRIPGTGAVMSTDPRTPDERQLDDEQGVTSPEPTDDAAPDADPDEVEPAFAIDLEPDEQGLAGSGEEPSG